MRSESSIFSKAKMAEIDGAGPNDAGTRIRSGVGWDLPEPIDCGVENYRLKAGRILGDWKSRFRLEAA